MAGKNSQASKLIDGYIKDAPAFARPICRKLRSLIHKADKKIKEDWKWGPNFNKRGMICGFGAFQNHVSLAFFKGALMKDPNGILIHGGSNVHNRMAQFTSVDDVDEKTLIEYVKEAIAINESGLKLPPRIKTVAIPDDLRDALSANMIAEENFNNLAYTYRKEYVDWIESARRPETRETRISEVVRRSLLNQKLNEN